VPISGGLRLVAVLPDLALRQMPVYVLHTFDRQLPLWARLFVDFLVERIGAR
jgi:DNA-binding transcriptional LysR family regulator